MAKEIAEAPTEGGRANDARTVDSPLVAAARPERLAEGAFLAGRYLIEAEVGRGGGGTVYRAFDHGTQVRVALKVLEAHGGPRPQASEQLYRELRHGRAIQHPNVCRIYDVFEADGHHVLAMEYASAGTLRATLREQGAERPFAEKLADARGLIAGLGAIHRAGLVHRDLKPENVLRMSEGRLVVSDFGLTRALGQTTVTSGLAGTPGYLAPEILSGIKESQASDVWSLGVVLHEIFWGGRPEWPRVAPEALAARRPQDARLQAVSRIVRACLVPELGRRPASASEVEAQLDRALRSIARGRRWPGRLAVLALAGTVAGTVGVVAARRFRAARLSSARPASATLPARSTDWSQSRLILSQPGAFCLEALPPERRIVRAVSPDTGIALEIDVSNSAWKDVPFRLDRGCAAFSADGRSALFTRQPAGGAPQVVLAAEREGPDTTAIVAGAHARWLPSGRGFLFATDRQRLALGDLEGRITYLAEAGQAPFAILDTAVDDRGERAAALTRHRLPAEQTQLDLHDLRTRRSLGTWKLPDAGSDTVKFDPVRRTFQFPERRPGGRVWSELTPEGGIAVVGELAGRDISGAVRVEGGFLFSAQRRSTAGGLYRVGPDGAEQYISARATGFQVSEGGDVVYLQLDRSADRGGTVILKRPRTPILGLSDAGAFAEPTISRDGRTVAFVHRLTGEIFGCDLSSGDRRSGCRLARVDRGLHPAAGLALSPQGDTLAYVSLAYVSQPSGAQPSGAVGRRVRLLSLKGSSPRELASVDAQCAAGCRIHWPTAEVIRVCPARGSTVAEIDVASGRATLRPAGGEAVRSCERAQQGDHRYELRTWNVAELRYVPDLDGQPPG